LKEGGPLGSGGGGVAPGTEKEDVGESEAEAPGSEKEEVGESEPPETGN